MGEAGTGKTTLIKHTFLEYIKSGKQAIYTTADNLDLRIQSNNSFIFENSINFDNDLVLFIDGVDETFANNPSKLNSFINFANIQLKLYTFETAFLYLFTSIFKINFKVVKYLRYLRRRL